MLIIISIVFFLSLMAFMLIEGRSFLDSIYFIIVTISTVGFGDIHANHPLTKVITIVLIITGISSIAIFSEIGLSRLIEASTINRYLLNHKLHKKNHIIIGGYNSISKIIGRIFKLRLIEIVVIDTDDRK